MNTIDCIALGVMGFSLLIGFLQGFTREVLRIVTWSTAISTAYYGHSWLEPFLIPFVTKGIFLKAVSVVCVFMLVLIILNIISHHIAYKIRGTLLKGLDGTLGMILGGIRGSFLLLSAYAIFLSFKPAPTVFRQLNHTTTVSLMNKALLEIAALFPTNTTLKNLKLLIVKRQQDLPHSFTHHPHSQVNLGSSTLKQSPKASSAPPPPAINPPLWAYVKELFHFPSSSEQEDTSISPIEQPHSDSRKALNQLISSGKK